LTDQTNQTPDLGTPEGIAQTQVNTLLSNPAQIPAKFKDANGVVNVDALTASYLELERARSGVPATPVTETPAANAADAADALTQSDTSTPADAESLADALSEPKAPEGADLWTAVGKEFDETGSLSEGTVKGLLDAGVPQAMIEAAVAGRKIKQQQDMVKAADLVGGKEELDATLAWAKENLSDAEKQAIIPQLRGAQAETILMGLHARRVAAAPAASGQVDTSNIAGGTLPQGNPAANLVPFRDWNEQQSAMRDPRYQTDPDYRAECEARLILGAGYKVAR